MIQKQSKTDNSTQSADSKDKSSVVAANAPVIYEPYEKMDFNFRGVIEEISNRKIPIIVHNGFVDILHVK